LTRNCVLSGTSKHAIGEVVMKSNVRKRVIENLARLANVAASWL
jgi:hypothetical protein